MGNKRSRGCKSDQQFSTHTHPTGFRRNIPRKNIFIKMCLPHPTSLGKNSGEEFFSSTNFREQRGQTIPFSLQAIISNKVRPNLTMAKSKNNKSINRRFSWNIQLVHPASLKKFRNTIFIYLFIFHRPPFKEKGTSCFRVEE